MVRNVIFIVFSVFIIFLAGGCGQEFTSTADEPDSDEQTSSEEVANEDELPKESDESNDNETEGENEKETEAEEGSEQNTAEEEEAHEVSTEEEEPDAKEVTSELTAHYIDVGQADATLFEFEDAGQQVHILIDAGNWNSDNVVNYLHSRQVDQIDIAIATHPDADHIGQLDQVIEQFDVEEVWMSGNESTSDTYDRVLDAIEASGAEYEEPQAGDAFDIGPLEVDVLYPDSITGNTNKESISLKMSYGDTGFVFTGDAEVDDEAAMLSGSSNVEADILQLGHHGSSTSTSSSFLDAVSPEVAIYSAGADNQYGHPNAEVINRVEDAGIDLYGTDVHGTVEVTTDGESYHVATKEEGTVTPPDDSRSESEQETEEEPVTESESEIEGCVDINHASVEELQEITQIGPARAEDLIELRPYQSIDDLTKISGIGPARIDEIKAQGVACTGG
ncbi:MBL fold metallo-hydrolase [Halobacillus campisalis]|uniref:MBL fold metallo-hydrolase n=1 Tax=Halobacillus campisalis TaxID=435909 RepID=A0ABW2K043_9BACI|nr:MBL fold metallo-hydrolase [Halobacillus campisalis]